LLAAFFFRMRSIESAPLDYNYFSKVFILFISVVVLFVFGLTVLFWSSLPILSGWFSDEPRAAGIATYNSFALPLAIIMAFALTAVPLVKYQGFQLTGGLKKAAIVLTICAAIGFGLFYAVLSASLIFAVLFSLIVTGLAVYLFNPEFRKRLIAALVSFLVAIVVSLLLGVTNYTYLLFYSVAAMVLVSSLNHLASYFPNRVNSIGAPLAHFGFGVMLIGVLASSAYDTSERLTIARAQTVQSETFGISIGYNGMAYNIDYPDNRLLLSLDGGSGLREVRPEYYYSHRMGANMRKPYIIRSFSHDLYLAPQQVLPGDEGTGLALRRGESHRLGDLTLTFQEFEFGSHERMGVSGVSVAARIEITHGDKVRTVLPRLIQEFDEQGEAGIISESAGFYFGEQHYEMSILQILTDQGMVVLDIPGLMPEAEPEKLILGISKKPLISLVWIGTTLILLGSLVAMIRRWSELVKSEA